jgi:hypothetical protein
LRAILTAGAPLAGRIFTELVKEDERDAFAKKLRSADWDSATPLCMHLHLRGAFSSLIPVRVFFAKCVEDIGEMQFLIGVLEEADGGGRMPGIDTMHMPSKDGAVRASYSKGGDQSEGLSDAESSNPSDWRKVAAVEFQWTGPDEKVAFGKLRFVRFKLVSANQLALDWLGMQEDEVNGCDIEDFVSTYDFVTFQRSMQRTAETRDDWQCWQLGPLGLQNPYDLDFPVALPWLTMKFKNDVLVVRMFPMPGNGAESLGKVRLQGSAVNLRVSCATQPPYKVLRPNVHMTSVASATLLQQAEDDGIRRFFSSQDAASVETWVTERLQGAVAVDCVLGAVFAQFDVEPQTVWLRLIWPEPISMRRDEFLLSFWGSLEPESVNQTPRAPSVTSSSRRSSRSSRARGKPLRGQASIAVPEELGKRAGDGALMVKAEGARRDLTQKRKL